MSRFLVRAFIVVLLLAFATALIAGTGGEVVRFTEGRYLPVRSHEVEGDRISLDLGDALMVVPSFRVAEIRRDRRLVYGTPLRNGNLRLAVAPRREGASVARSEIVPTLR